MKKVILFILAFKACLASAEFVMDQNDISYYSELKFRQDEVNKPFYFIRHGQTDMNKYRIVTEDLDVPINEEGIIQARAAALLLKDRGIKVIVSSTMKRAKQTAEIINKELNVPIIYNDGLVEGNWGAKPGDNLDKKHINQINWYKGHETKGIESLYKFQSRVHNTIKDIVNNYEDVLIVGHGLYYINMVILLNGEYVGIKTATPLYLKPVEDKNKLYEVIVLEKTE